MSLELGIATLIFVLRIIIVRITIIRNTPDSLKQMYPTKIFRGFSVSAMSIVLAIAPWADNANASAFIDEVTIVGERHTGQQVAGSAHYVDLSQIERLGHSDIQRIIRQIPGVSVQVEDGYGLRPNISIRGVSTERSGRITLLEDNVLIAPAPYSAPSAYYFPTVGRMTAIEVLKGPAAITQGPYTIGGALNMISTPIPEEAGGRLVFEAGEDHTTRAHATYGAQLANGFGFLVEAHHWKSDGFQDVDRGGSSGLDVADYTVKLRYAPTGSAHRAELKLQYATQQSDQSYIGLSDRDFADDPYRRYGLSRLDNIDTEHEQFIFRYEWDLSDSMTLSSTYYNNGFKRDWFKNEGVDFDGSPNAESFSRTGWSSVIQAINRNEGLDGVNTAALQAILDGANTASGSIQLRSNDREYFSRGVQLELDWLLKTSAITHDLTLGLRIHEDEEDRLQRNSTYTQSDGQLVLDDFGQLGNAGNRVQTAEAISVHLYDQMLIGNWTITPGIRFERIEQQRTRYETRSDQTLNPASRAGDNLRDIRKNDTDVWLPGLGVSYSFTNALMVFGGVHKGFTAPTNAPGVDEEEAINYELGARFTRDDVQAEAALFFSDYDNLLGECTASSGVDCEIGDAFNGDAASVQGVEVLVTGILNRKGRISVPIDFTYTYINGEFDSDIADTDFFGDVEKGDPIPYIPENQLNVSVGLEGQRWGIYVAGNYVDAVCTRASCGAFEETDDTFVVDLSGRYEVSAAIEIFARVENLTGANDILGRQPSGARPNKATTVSLGIRAEL
ncbi:MAG: TonB-dependent receptor [Pseudomonadales bacterium]